MNQFNYTSNKEKNKHLSLTDLRYIEREYNHFIKTKQHKQSKVKFMRTLAASVHTCLSNLYKMSKIPESHFDREAQATWFGTDPTQQLRDEINFSRFVTRMRSTFGEIILKPIRIQIALNIPDIKNDKRILDSISLHFNSYNQFTELAEQEVMSKRVEFIGTMKDSLVITNEEGEEEPFFDPEFLILKYLKMSEADLELNKKMKEEKKLKKVAGGNPEGENDEEETEEETGAEGEEGGGEEAESPESEESGGEIDSEMLGDVQPESSETTQA